MEDSFELLSTMSPKVKGKQKTLSVKKASTLALKKHFRRSMIFDHHPIKKKEDLSVIEISSDSFQSATSSVGEVNQDNDLNVIEASYSDSDINNKKVVNWLEDVKEQTGDTFFSQVSTIVGEEPLGVVKEGVAVCSSFNDSLTHRFDELFIKKPLVEDVSSNFKLELSDSKTMSETVYSSPENCTKTPSNKSIKQAKSILDSIYGDSWRKKQKSVLKPLLSEEKLKVDTKQESENNRPKIKENLFNSNPTSQQLPGKLKFHRLKGPTESPWMKKWQELIDSDSDPEAIKEANVPHHSPVRLNFTKDDQVSNKKLAKEQQPIYDSDDSENYNKEIEILEKTRRSTVRTRTKTYTFLESLSATVPINKCDFTARVYRNNFKGHREELTRKLFQIFNEQVFDNALPADTELVWSKNLRKTAGLCHCTKITHRNGVIDRKVKITLSAKVVDKCCRLRDTLIHELCHAATWIVDQVSGGHGPYWKQWAFKAMKVLPELPPIKRCHAYAIATKFTYRCTGCGYSIGRHSKSLDLDRKRCGHCYGQFEVLLNKKTKSGELKSVPATPKKEPNGFALFVKENYAQYKDPLKKHGDVMRILGQKFAEIKLSKNSV
ncbi:hypothetical protein ABEB36_011682 [Hypothenemus hampei]|uniref:SprT-like domain-containing protein n=1 Tax=Hypothenemus hampei TaxID=57062 RepID=A0ABD1E8X8_HYPHA